MKLILLYLAVVLCTVCKATNVRNRAGFHTSAHFGVGLFPLSKLTRNAKSSDGSKDNKLSEEGKSNLKNELKLGIDGSANLRGSHPSPIDARASALSLLSGMELLPKLGDIPSGDIHGVVSAGTEIRGHGGSGSGTSSGSSRPSVHSSNGLSTGSGDGPQGQDVAASSRFENKVESSSSSTGSATSNAGAYRPSAHSSNSFSGDSEPIVNNDPTEARGSGTSSGSSRLNVHHSSGLSTEFRDDPAVQGPQAAEQNVESSSSSTGSATSNGGAGTPSEHSSDLLFEKIKEYLNAARDSASSGIKYLRENIEKILEAPTEERGKPSTSASVSGTSSGSSTLHFSSSSELPAELGNGHTVQDQPTAVSVGNAQDVDTSSLSTGSATSNEENTSGSGDSSEVSGPSSSAVVATDSGVHGKLENKQGPGFNGHEGDRENNSESFGAGSLDTGNKNGSGSHNLSSGTGSSVRSDVSARVDPSDQTESAGLGVSACTGKTLSGSPLVA